jgi:hypothetical protein
MSQTIDSYQMACTKVWAQRLFEERLLAHILKTTVELGDILRASPDITGPKHFELTRVLAKSTVLGDKTLLKGFNHVGKLLLTFGGGSTELSNEGWCQKCSLPSAFPPLTRGGPQLQWLEHPAHLQGTVGEASLELGVLYVKL